MAAGIAHSRSGGSKALFERPALEPAPKQVGAGTPGRPVRQTLRGLGGGADPVVNATLGLEFGEELGPPTLELHESGRQLGVDGSQIGVTARNPPEILRGPLQPPV